MSEKQLREGSKRQIPGTPDEGGQVRPGKHKQLQRAMIKGPGTSDDGEQLRPGKEKLLQTRSIIHFPGTPGDGGQLRPRKREQLQRAVTTVPGTPDKGGQLKPVKEEQLQTVEMKNVLDRLDDGWQLRPGKNAFTVRGNNKYFRYSR